EADMRAHVDALGLGGAVEFCGQITARATLVRLLSESLAMVLPSYSEGFPRVAYECFALGVPTILTPVGGIPHVVAHGQHCLLVPRGDAGRLADAMERLLVDDDLRERLSVTARELMRDKIFPRIRRNVSLARMVAKAARGLFFDEVGSGA